MKHLILMAVATLSILSCNSAKKAEETEEPAEKKVLVLYYSQTGATKLLAEEISTQLGADIEAIEVETPYDGTFQETIERCQKEMAEDVIPALVPIKADVESYDVVFLGYPVWFGTYARPIESLLKTEKFAGKKVVTFCTFGSGGLQASTTDVKAALPEAEVIEGYGVRNARVAAIPDEVNRFLIEGGFKDGEIEALPAFMEHKPVTEADVEVFNQACGDYQFPLGTPVDVAVRETSTSTDYEFYVEGQEKDGSKSMSTIYVTVVKKEGAKAEFTQVVR